MIDEAVTAALPPPAVMGEVVPSAPITAIDEVVDASGSTLPVFCSRTVPSWEFCWANATWEPVEVATIW